jgi:receptor protein-tyrosine kinase
VETTEYKILRSDLDRALQQLAVLQTEADILSDRSSIELGAGEIVQKAEPERIRGKASHARNFFLGLLVGVPLALGIVLVLDAINDNVRTRDEAEQQTGAEVIGLIPFDEAWTDPATPRLASVADPLSPVAESYRTLRENLLQIEPTPRRILVTSPAAGSGKTAASANLAVAFAEVGRPVVLVDVDLRRPRSHEFLGVPLEPGLSDVLANEMPLKEVLQRPRPDLAVVSAGRPSVRPDLVLARADLGALLNGFDQGPAPRRRRTKAAVSASGDGVVASGTDGARPADPLMILFDAPPILNAAEVSSLASVVDGVVLVVRAGGTRRLAARRAAEQVRRVGGRLLGVVLVGVSVPAEFGVDEAYFSYYRRPEPVAGPAGN